MCLRDAKRFRLAHPRHLEMHALCMYFPLPTEEFLEHAVTYQQFVDNPGIIDDPNLVVKIGNK